MSKFNQAKRIAKRVHSMYAKSMKLSEKIDKLYNQGKITKDEYNSLAD